MLIDDKGKLFGKLNIIDFLVILVILVGIGGVGYKFTKSKTISPFVKTKDIVLTFYGDEIPEFAASKINKGDTSKDFDKGTYFGTVSSLKIDKAVSIGMNDQGQYIKASRPGFSSVMVTVEGKGIFDNNGVTIDNSDYFVGKSISLRLGNSVIFSRLYDIREKR